MSSNLVTGTHAARICAALCIAVAASCAAETSGGSERHPRLPSEGEVDPIVDGTTTTDYPEVGRFVLVGPSGEASTLCSGTLFTERLVLTAAHCFDSFPRPGLVGVISRPLAGGAELFFEVAPWGDRPTARRVPVATFTVHDAYVFPRNDIAIVKLTERIRDVGVGAGCGTRPVAPCPNSVLARNPVRVGAFNAGPLVAGQGAMELVGWGRAQGDLATSAGVKRALWTRPREQRDGEIFFPSGVCRGDSGGAVVQHIHGWDSFYTDRVDYEWRYQTALMVRTTEDCDGGAALLLEPYYAWMDRVESDMSSVPACDLPDGSAVACEPPPADDADADGPSDAPADEPSCSTDTDCASWELCVDGACAAV